MTYRKYPKKANAKDKTLMLAKLAAAAVAVVHPPVGVGIELLNDLLTPSLQRRRDEWFEWVGEELVLLAEEHKGLKEQLQTREDFTTIAVQASQMAVKTHQREKHEALRNAVLNTALNPNPSEDIALTYLTILDDFTPSHLKVLQAIHDTRPRYELSTTVTYAGTVVNERHTQIAQDVYSHLQVKYPEEFFKQILTDLGAKGLITEIREDVAVMPPNGVGVGSIVILSEYGQDFLEFVSSPKD